MTDTARTPSWIWIGVTTMVAQHLVVLIVHPITVLSVISLGVTVLFALFVLRGSRVAWALSVFSAAALLIAPITLDQPLWFAGAAAIILACLLASPSRAFVWSQGQPREPVPRRSARQLYGRFMTMIYGLLGRAPWIGGESIESRRVDKLSRRKLIVLLVISILVLYPLIGLFYKFHHGAARGSVFVDVLWEVTWRFFTLAQLALIVLLVIEVYRRYFVTRSTHGS